MWVEISSDNFFLGRFFFFRFFSALNDSHLSLLLPPPPSLVGNTPGVDRDHTADMPKSGFDPQRHQRKLHRHNPLSKSGSASASASNSTHASPSSVSSATLDVLQQATKIANASSAVPSAPAKDIVPLLSNLPAPDSDTGTTAASASKPISLADKVWSLASVSLLLTVSPTQSAAQVKHNRKLLLSHNIVGRLLLALQSHTEVDVRREASGALRNLCVDSGIEVRNQIVNKGGISTILSAMRWASNAFGFDASSSQSSSCNPSASFVDDTPTLQQDLEAKCALLAIPLDQLNKKQKRHATKLAAALGKTLEQVAGQGLSAQDQQKLLLSASSDSSSNDAIHTGTASTAHRSAEPFIGLDSNTRKGLLEMAENLVTLVWCLCESGDKAFIKLVTWKWIDQDVVDCAVDEISGQGLAAWLSSSVALGCRAAAVLSTAGADGARASSSAAETLGVLTNEELSLLLDLALASGNALCALTDGGEPDFIDGMLARRSSEQSCKKKGAKPALAALAVPKSIDQQPASATRCLASIQSALSLLEACVQTDASDLHKLRRYVHSQSTMLGVLCAGVLRNLAAAVDSKAAAALRSKSRKHGSVAASTMTSSSIFVPIGDAASGNGANGAPATAVSLKTYEESLLLPTLTSLLCGVDMTKLAHDLDGRGDTSEAVALESTAKDTDESVLRAKMQAKAEEKAQTLILALEVLAEMAGSLDAHATGGGEEDADEWMENADADAEADADAAEEDDEDEEEMDMFDHGERIESDDGADDDDMGVGCAQDTFADAVKRNGSLPFQAYAPVLSRMFGTSDGSLGSALLTLSRPFEASFPSLTSSTSDKPTSGVLRALHLRSLSVLNNLLLRLATFSPPPPSQPVTDAKVQRRIGAFRTWIHAGPQNDVLKRVWLSLFEIAKGCASVPAVASAGAGLGTHVNNVDVGVSGVTGGLHADEGCDGLTMVETCIGGMWSIARLLEGNLPLSTTSSIDVSHAAAVQSEIVVALQSGYASASSDAMRVKCILTLSTLARSAQIDASVNAHIGAFLVSILESIADAASNSTSGTTPESMVAAINGIIDTYADESSHYDSLAFRHQNLLSRIRLTVFNCKALAKHIDRRKHPSLRESAQEAIENLLGFVQYRQALRL